MIREMKRDSMEKYEEVQKGVGRQLKQKRNGAGIGEWERTDNKRGSGSGKEQR